MLTALSGEIIMEVIQLIEFRGKEKRFLWKLWTNEKVTRYTNISYPLKKKEWKDRIAIIVQNQDTVLKKTVFVAYVDKKPVGIVGCPVLSLSDNTFGLFYQFDSKYWGKGIGKRCVKNLMEYMQYQYPGHALYADVVKENYASRKILETLGFIVISEGYGEFQKDGIGRNIIHYSYQHRDA